MEDETVSVHRKSQRSVCICLPHRNWTRVQIFQRTECSWHVSRPYRGNQDEPWAARVPVILVSGPLLDARSPPPVQPDFDFGQLWILPEETQVSIVWFKCIRTTELVSCSDTTLACRYENVI